MRSYPFAAHQLDGPVGDNRHQAVTVVLHFVQPTLAVGRLGSRRDNLERDPLWQISRDRPGGKREFRHGGNVNIGTRGDGRSEQLALARVGLAPDARAARMR